MLRTYILNFIEKHKPIGNPEDLLKIQNTHWVSVSDIQESKLTFIFRSNNQLLVSNNGVVTKAKWEFISNESILIDLPDISYILKYTFMDSNLLILRVDGTNNLAVFINESKYGYELNTINDVVNYIEQIHLPLIRKETILPVLSEIYAEISGLQKKMFSPSESELQHLVHLLEDVIHDKSDASNLISIYFETYKRSLIQELKSTSKLKSNISFILSPLIKIGYLNEAYPHNAKIV